MKNFSGYVLSNLKDLNSVFCSGSYILGVSSIAIAPNGNIVVALTKYIPPIGVSTNTSVQCVIATSSDDGLTWTERQTISISSYEAWAYTMIAKGNDLYLSVMSEFCTSNATYQGRIYKSSDNGITWNLVFYTNQYAIQLSEVFDGDKIGVALYQALYPLDYQDADVDFGWFNTSDNTLSGINRLSTHGDEGTGSFPSEIFFYKRPIDNGIVSGIRWGEYPDIPYLKLKISFDNGITWKPFGSQWSGYAGMANITVFNGNYFCCGYFKPDISHAYSVIWQIDPNTGQILKTHYPFNDSYIGVWFGNGQLCNKNDKIYFVLGNDEMTFGIMEFSKIFNSGVALYV